MSWSYISLSCVGCCGGIDSFSCSSCISWSKNSSEGGREREVGKEGGRESGGGGEGREGEKEAQREGGREREGEKARHTMEALCVCEIGGKEFLASA